MSNEFTQSDFSLALARISEAAAIAAAHQIGRGNAQEADQVAVDAMRSALNKLAISGTIVIGEGERDEAPMLYIGENVGTGGTAVDIALDPLEGTNLTANGAQNALAVIAVGAKNSLLHAPDVYMDKLAIGPGFAPDTVTLEMSPSERIYALARAKKTSPQDITACVLERSRHEEMIAEIRTTKARVILIPDGDVAAIMQTTTLSETSIDIYMGSGGAPEGVLAAAALSTLGGQIYGRLIFRNEDEYNRARKAGITDFNRIYRREDMVKSDVIFAATGVTDGMLVKGVKFENENISCETLLLNSKTHSVRHIRCQKPL